MIKIINKKKGIATIAIILIVIVGLGVIGGGIAYFVKNNSSQEEKGENFGSGTEQARVFQYEDLPKGTLEDLIIGETVAVNGVENQDGSITANLIFIGTPEQEFFERDGDQEQRMERNWEGEGERPPMLEDIDPEEMRARMEELRESRPMRGGSASVRGEIIDKDEISITIRIEEGGSKIIFYSSEIQIIKREE